MTNKDIPIEKLYEKTGSIYKLVILASRRALELNNGATRLVDIDTDRVGQVALQEILDGKVTYKQAKQETDEK